MNIRIIIDGEKLIKFLESAYSFKVIDLDQSVNISYEKIEWLRIDQIRCQELLCSTIICTLNNQILITWLSNQHIATKLDNI